MCVHDAVVEQNYCSATSAAAAHRHRSATIHGVASQTLARAIEVMIASSSLSLFLGKDQPARTSHKDCSPLPSQCKLLTPTPHAHQPHMQASFLYENLRQPNSLVKCHLPCHLKPTRDRFQGNNALSSSTTILFANISSTVKG
jgi:hypothetical protein